MSSTMPPLPPLHVHPQTGRIRITEPEPRWVDGDTLILWAQRAWFLRVGPGENPPSKLADAIRQLHEAQLVTFAEAPVGPCCPECGGMVALAGQRCQDCRLADLGWELGLGSLGLAGDLPLMAPDEADELPPISPAPRLGAVCSWCERPLDPRARACPVCCPWDRGPRKSA